MGLDLSAKKVCSNCGAIMIRRPSKFNNGFWYSCSNFPRCRGETPEEREVKDLRIAAHKLSEELWGDWNSPRCKKGEMYSWLKSNTKSGHFGKMEKAELIETIDKLKTFIKYKDVK